MRQARRPGWSHAHVLASAAAAVVTYCWFGFTVQHDNHGQSVASLAIQAVLVVAALVLVWRVSRAVTTRDAPAAPPMRVPPPPS